MAGSSGAHPRGKRFRSTWRGPGVLLAFILVTGWVLLKIEIQGRVMPWVFGLSVAAVAWFLAWRQLRLSWTIADTPTVAVKAVSAGRCEVKGRITAAQPMMAHFTGIPAAWCKWEVQEYRRGGRSSSWVTVEHGTDIAPGVYVYDDTGSIWVDMQNAEVQSPRTLLQGIPGSRPKRRNVEHALYNSAEVYVLGGADMLEDAPAMRISLSEDTPFLVSYRSERDVRRRTRLTQWAIALAGLTFGVLGAWIQVTEASGTGRGRHNGYTLAGDGHWFAGAVALAYLGAFVAGYLVWQYNRLVDVRNRAQAAWSLIDVQLTRRATLIPELATVVREYARYEQDVQFAVAFQRAESQLPTGPEVARASTVAGTQSLVASELLGVAEQYPDLKASENFLALQHALADAEERIALARRFYNDALETWRDRSQVFPWSLLARLVQGPDLEFFHVGTEVELVPEVSAIDHLAGS